MKTTIKLFLFVLSVSIFSSCSDSSTSVDVTADDLVGVWNLTDINGEGTSTTTINGQSITADVTTTGRRNGLWIIQASLHLTLTGKPRLTL